ncbi:MAG TPA: MerR family transcriptional regulator [Polyangiaceae bacterium]|jgi:DNA-binding transcriptional MerR regulator|nr:MerR family transcriptional regulator [Polyangiaceae bacterium]
MATVDRDQAPDAGSMPRALPVRLPLLEGGAFDALGRPEPKARARDEALEPPLQVGDLAKAVGKTVRAIHHYEELGLLRPDARSKGRFRLYDPSAVTRVRWIGKLCDLGMSLSQIKTVLDAWEGAPTAARAMSEVRATYLSKLEETRTQIAHLQELERELEASVRYLDTCNTCDEPAALPPPATGSHHAALHTSGAQIDGAPTNGAHHHHNGTTCDACQLREREREPDLVAGIVAG